MWNVDVLPLLSPVTINGDIRATIIAVTLRPAHSGALAVHYECEWWNGRSIETHAFNSDLIKPITDSGLLRIGFQKD